jgi:hypothetical protein
MWRLGYLAVAVSILGLFGCGGDGLRRVAVQGKVAAQGVPVGNATVSFVPVEATKGEGGIGTTDADGNFTLTGSRRGDAGVVPGKYRVVVSRFMNPDGTVIPSADYKEADFPRAVNSVPAPYSLINSPLLVTVPEDGGAINVEIPVKVLGKQK